MEIQLIMKFKDWIQYAILYNKPNKPYKHIEIVRKPKQHKILRYTQLANENELSELPTHIYNYNDKDFEVDN